MILLLLGLALVAAGCDDEFGPQVWVDLPDTVTIYSLARPELLGLPGAYDIVNRGAVRIEQPGMSVSWDLALSEEGGQFVLLPSGVLPDNPSPAALAHMPGADFKTLDAAPKREDSRWVDSLAVPLTVGEVYVVRSRPVSCIYVTGSYFAKMRAVSVDPVVGSVTLELITNPYCNDRALVPPDED